MNFTYVDVILNLYMNYVDIAIVVVNPIAIY